MSDQAGLPVDNPHKLYVLVREDLAPGLRAAQLAHAVAEICMQSPEKAWEWHRNGNYLIVLGVPNEKVLGEWISYVTNLWEVPTMVFREPDLDYSMTAFACLPPPEMNALFSPLPLAYRVPKRRWFRRNP